MHTKFLSEILNERDLWEELGVDVKMILEFILGKKAGMV
jgi:hypothetical protein